MPGKKKYTLGQKVEADLHDLVLPSGATCQARRPGVQGLIAAGLLDNFDELTALVQTEHIDPKTQVPGKITPAQAEAAVQVLTRDKDKLLTAFHLMDRLTTYVVTEPKVWVDYQMKDEPDEAWDERQKQAQKDGAIPVRVIDMDDKMFLLNWAVGGSSDLNAFREGSKELLGNMVAG